MIYNVWMGEHNLLHLQVPAIHTPLKHAATGPTEGHAELSRRCPQIGKYAYFWQSYAGKGIYPVMAG